MLTAGNLFEQPVELWFRVNNAGFTWQVLEKMSKQNLHTEFSTAENKMVEKIQKIRGRWK